MLDFFIEFKDVFDRGKTSYQQVYVFRASRFACNISCKKCAPILEVFCATSFKIEIHWKPLNSLPIIDIEPVLIFGL